MTIAKTPKAMKDKILSSELKKWYRINPVITVKYDTRNIACRRLAECDSADCMARQHMLITLSAFNRTLPEYSLTITLVQKHKTQSRAIDKENWSLANAKLLL